MTLIDGAAQLASTGTLAVAGADTYAGPPPPFFRPGGAQATVVRAPFIAGRYRNQERDWANATRTTYTGVNVQPYAINTESIADREFTSTHLRSFWPSNVDITATDRVEFAGSTYEVDGAPAVWFDDIGQPDHIEASLKQMAG